ncbi:MAG: tetratricopeptide repeat protein [Chthoniobacteraceae bacterium]
MNLLNKLFGKKTTTDTTTAEPAPMPIAEPVSETAPAPVEETVVTAPGAPATIKTFDSWGRMHEVPREEWRKNVLLPNLRNVWTNPDSLAAMISDALNNGFISDCLEPARQLHQIDTIPQRGAVFLAVILLQLQQLDEAGQILTEAISQHGEDAILLTNLAKVQAAKGDLSQVAKTRWHALELNPNLDHALLWFASDLHELGGDTAAAQGLRKVAALPGSWRAQLWLAGLALREKKLDEALDLHRESLANAGRPVPGDLLQQMSGDLGNAGHLVPLLQMVEPNYQPEAHGLPVGNNLIKANFDLGQLDAAEEIMKGLYALQRPDWKPQLNYWETEIAKARVSLVEPKPQEMELTMLTVDGPVWLKPESLAAELYPVKGAPAPAVVVMGGTAEIASNSQKVEKQLSDIQGRLSRAVPLWLAEQLNFHSNASVQTLVPWVMGEAPGFVLSGKAWDDEMLATQGRQTEPKNDYVVGVHINTTVTPWQVELRLVRTIDGQCLATHSGEFSLDTPEPGMQALAKSLLTLLREHTDVQSATPPELYQVPGPSYFASYLLRLEQLLTVRCAGMEEVKSNFLHGEREVVDGNLQLCLEFPQSVNLRILLAQTLLILKRVRPEVPQEYREKIALLQKEKPLPEPAQGIVQKLLDEAVG